MKKLRSSCMVPPECCVVIEMEKGARLGFRKAVLLQEIEALGSVKQAARVSKIEHSHAQELIREMNRCFTKPLVSYPQVAAPDDHASLTPYGAQMVSTYWKQFEPIWLSILEERARHY
ncbi:winged helix-turn-helix domain-containing protein [Desulfogranum japonicum]|uniref:winged helix-turn-helix domain-containing protein n=1 Tax=Desulfogranum japonicum TaxID=231447 RepID=UPI0012947800|nr:hypothetical protein [Desulfogranum japonicum]